jgi:glycosyltransferase involved in cell wall biosynthesis
VKVAFVTPWYGTNILGGAETAARRTVEQLHRSGVSIEVLTTCVRDFHADWGRNAHKAGSALENGIPVHHFPVRRRDREAFDTVNWKLMHGISVPPEEEEIYIRENVRSPALTRYIAEHRKDYQFVFTPYMFGTTYWGIQACEGEAFLIPCLHDEAYARMGIFRHMFSQVKNLIFYSSAELELARSLYCLPEDVSVLLGTGVDTDFVTDAPAFRTQYTITSPFILYAGRKDIGKNVDLLIDYFRRYRAQRDNDVNLVLIGGGALPEANHNEGILDLGYIPLQDKYNAYAAATVLCQPSLKESFSLVLMEAWVAGTPALVHSRCAVTKEHCTNSNGGLYFENYAEFEACLDLLLNQSSLREALGLNGRRYVLENYRWDVIVDRYRSLLNQTTR